MLEERYRENYLGEYCASESCKTSNKAEWREMVGATFAKHVHVRDWTSVDQDRHLIEEFNSLPNKNHFNGVTRNCANFTRRVINGYFPGATGADYINDFGMTSPKAIARSFTRYANAIRMRISGFFTSRKFPAQSSGARWPEPEPSSCFAQKSSWFQC